MFLRNGSRDKNRGIRIKENSYEWKLRIRIRVMKGIRTLRRTKKQGIKAETRIEYRFRGVQRNKVRRNVRPHTRELRIRTER